MRVLFDARSVRTATGSYILNGLTSSWRDDRRVSEIFVAMPEGFDRAQISAEVTPVLLPANDGWLRHVMLALSRAADRVQADVIFCANGTGPRDARTVLYFQDLFHFRYRDGELPLREQLLQLGRAAWRSVAAPRSALGVAVSRTIADEAKQDVRRLPIVEIPNGVDVGSVRWTGDSDIVYVAGGTGARKSEETAVHAWARLGRRPPTATLEIGGVEPIGRRTELERLISDLGVRSSVQVHGAIPREAYLERMARARVTVSCSRLESFGLPVAEAVAMGAPVLCSDIAAHRELLARAGVGESFPVGDVTALATRLRHALEQRLPSRLTSAPLGWGWNARGRQHIDAYQQYIRPRDRSPDAA
jgi:glycosyltransferase involved in cell wall biosynthesis